MILLDTHTFIWWASDQTRLSPNARRFMERHADTLAISVVSSWEIALLCKKNRLELPLPPAVFIEKALEHHGIEEFSLDRETVLKAVALPDIHQDPFDRVLIAEALKSNLRLVTKDSLIPKYPGLRVIW